MSIHLSQMRATALHCVLVLLGVVAAVPSGNMFCDAVLLLKIITTSPLLSIGFFGDTLTLSTFG